MRKVDGQPQTTAQQIGSLIKSARDIMRKDKGLSTDLDRLPLLTWVMFLKFLDDMEQIEESRAAVRGEKYRPAIEPPYRWRDWAAKEDGITGPELLAFINQEEATRPDGKKGAGLLAYLRGLIGGNGSARRRRVIATVFKDVNCRMLSGYLLRDVINKVNGINFLAKEEVFTLGHLYESMLREMRDAAGENGEFYTPRPVVKFMVEVVNPHLGEVVLDPACGTGGFLVEAYTHLDKQCQTVSDRRTLQDKSLRGGEAKPLPYLLCQMNLLLHGLEAPDIDPENSLRFKLTEIGDRDRVDMILTNPPFGGEEEAGIKGNFPADRQTSETALLFLQLIMRKLKRGGKTGRAAVVVPNGTLFGDGVCARIKEELLTEFNLHTVVRLPLGVFAPYTDQETAILFFERCATGTETVWFYQHPLPPDRAQLKNPCYRKSCPILYEEFAPLIAWWGSRKQTDCAWAVSAADIVAGGYNLDLHHPSRNGCAIIRSRGEILQAVGTATNEMKKASEHLVQTLAASLHALPSLTTPVLKTLVELGILINTENRNPERTPDDEFVYVDLSCVGLNVIDGAKTIKGRDAPSRARRVIREGDVLLSTVRPYLCGHAVVPEYLNNQICSTGFSVLRCPQTVNPMFLYYMLTSPQVIGQFHSCMRGAHYPALKDEHVQKLLIPELDREEQDRIVEKLDEFAEQIRGCVASLEAFSQRLTAEAKSVLSSVVSDVYGITSR